MSNEPNKKRIGLFLLIGFICLFGIIGKFVADKIMPQKDNLVVMFFDETVKGLSVGSPVVLEGVEVGKVVRISLEADLKERSFRIPVYMRFANNLNATGVLLKTQHEREVALKELIDRGLRARLVTQNFLTGQLMVELVMAPETPITYVTSPTTAHLPQIPTMLSTIGELSKGIQDLPLRDIVYKLDKVMDTLNQELPVLLPKYTDLGENMSRLAQRADTVVDQFDSLSGSLTQTAKRIEKTIPQTTQTLNHINRTLDSIEQAANSLRNLTDYLERHPESLLRGKGK